MKNLKTSKSKRIQRGGSNYEYSEDCKSWVPARQYQNEAAREAAKNPSKLYTYNKSGVTFDLVPLKSLFNINYFAMIKEDKSVAFLRQTVTKYKASKNFNANYLGQDITIKAGNFYYAMNPKQPIIGWHGSINPPTDMDGNLKYNISNSNAVSDKSDT